ncbi:hypothetical protein Dimus_001683 [Dionaea muscipula]
MATISSSFSTPFQTFKYPKPKHLWAPSEPLKLGCSRTQLVSQSQNNHGIEALSITYPSRGRRQRPRIAAAVFQQEAVEVQEGEVEDEVKVNTKLYFGNLPYSCDSPTLAGLVQQYANPELVEVLYDRETGISRGYAFVTMTSIEDCEKVIQNLDGSELLGRYLKVNFSDKPKPKEPLFHETGYKLFVGNLSWSVTSEILQRAFQDCGNVVGAWVIHDGLTGRSRGFGFVSYATKLEMEKALESLDGLELEGRAIRVRVAQGKKLQY